MKSEPFPLHRNQAVIDKVVSNIDLADINACWVWKGHKTPKGHGRIKFEGKSYYTHRLVWMVTTGEWLDDHEFVEHLCNNASCVNPNHLRRGDVHSNNRYRLESGNYHGKGRKRRKLTVEDVIAIKIRLRFGHSATAISIDYNCNVQTIYDIRSKKTWAHVRLEPKR